MPTIPGGVFPDFTPILTDAWAFMQSALPYIVPLITLLVGLAIARWLLNMFKQVTGAGKAGGGSDGQTVTVVVLSSGDDDE